MSKTYPTKGVAKAVEVGPIFHFLCENVTGIALACNMEDFDAAILDPFLGVVVPKFHMAHILYGGSVSQIDGGFVVIVHQGGFGGVGEGSSSHTKSIV